MHSETNILDFINHNCLPNDVLFTQLREEPIEGNDSFYDTFAERDDIARYSAQAQKFLC